MPTETRQCQNCKQNFVIEPEDFNFYEKIKVPAPTWCPECSLRRKFLWRNERTLYKSACGLCRRSIITMYNPNSSYVVYCNDCWTSDKWDSYAYGMDYNPTRSFFEQLLELTKRVPKSATYSSAGSGPNINSEYANFAGGNKDAYLVSNCGPNNENIAYSRGLIDSHDTFDTYYGDKVELTYEGIGVHRSTGIVWGQNVTESLDSRFLLNCSDCQKCFGCVNLRHKSHHFFNEPLSKVEWQRRVSNIIGSHSKIEEMKRQYEKFSMQFPRRENNNLKISNCTGDYIFESKNCLDCFEVSYAEDCKHAFSIKKARDCYGVIGHCRFSELIFECVGVGAHSSRIIGSWWVENSHDVEYCIATRASEYCFGCEGIRGGKYVILNKKYSEDEYKKLRAGVIKELKDKNLYGMFFPPALTFFGYNETIGQDNLPLSKEEALGYGFRWEENIPATRSQETLKPEQIPDHIKDVPDSILNEVLACVECGRNYRLIDRELDFYRRLTIPIPRRCWNCRFIDRLRRRGPFKLYARQCMCDKTNHHNHKGKCEVEFETSYAPERPGDLPAGRQVVYCEKCYQQEVY